MLERFSMQLVLEKLADLGGVGGTFKERDWRIRCRLNWHHKAASTIRHMLYRERVPTAGEAREIEAAHLKYCAEKAVRYAEESKQLYEQMRTAITAMEAADAEFYRPHIEALGELLHQRRNQAGEKSDEV